MPPPEQKKPSRWKRIRQRLVPTRLRRQAGAGEAILDEVVTVPTQPTPDVLARESERNDSRLPSLIVMSDTFPRALSRTNFQDRPTTGVMRRRRLPESNMNDTLDLQLLSESETQSDFRRTMEIHDNSDDVRVADDRQQEGHGVLWPVVRVDATSVTRIDSVAPPPNEQTPHSIWELERDDSHTTDLPTSPTGIFTRISDGFSRGLADSMVRARPNANAGIEERRELPILSTNDTSNLQLHQYPEMQQVQLRRRTQILDNSNVADIRELEGNEMGKRVDGAQQLLRVKFNFNLDLGTANFNRAVPLASGCVFFLKLCLAELV